MDTLIKYVFDRAIKMLEKENVNHITFPLPFNEICGVKMGICELNITTVNDENKRIIVQICLRSQRFDRLLYSKNDIIMLNNPAPADQEQNWDERLFVKLRKSIKDLNTLSLNILYGTLETDGHGSACGEFLALCCSAFENTPQIKLEYKECCVCNVLTKSNYKCGHTVCILCDSKLTNDKCPLCRADLNDEEEQEED